MDEARITCNYCNGIFKYCNKEVGLNGTYKRFYEPSQFIEGKKNSLIWVVGINQAFNEGQHDLDKLYPKKKGWDKSRYTTDDRTTEDLEDAFSLFKDKDKPNNYYLNFKDISYTLYHLMGLDYGVASTEVIRCGSVYNKPEAHLGASFEEFVELEKFEKREVKQLRKLWEEVPEKIRVQCKKHFKELLDSKDVLVPKVIICNGKPARKTLIELLLSVEEIEKILEETKQEKIEDVPYYNANYEKDGMVNKIVVVQVDFVGRQTSKLTKRTIGIIIDKIISELQILELRETLMCKSF